MCRRFEKWWQQVDNSTVLVTFFLPQHQSLKDLPPKDVVEKLLRFSELDREPESTGLHFPAQTHIRQGKGDYRSIGQATMPNAGTLLRWCFPFQDTA